MKEMGGGARDMRGLTTLWLFSGRKVQPRFIHYGVPDTRKKN